MEKFEYELYVKALPEKLSDVLNFIESILAIEGLDKEAISRISLASEEIFINIAHYAYPDPGMTDFALVRITGGDNLLIEFIDGGVAYNPLTKSDPDVALPVDKRRIGGLGVYLAKRLTDGLEYRREDGKNILMIKYSNSV